MKRPIKKCHICGIECELTYEHIPPEGAYNDKPAKVIMGEEIFKDLDRIPWETSGLRYKNMQNGVGLCTLCESCNNNTGSWYGKEYVLFSNTVYEALAKNIEELDTAECFKFHVYKMHPLQFFKQIISMFVSTFDASFLDAHTDIREYLLNRYSTDFPYNDIKIGMYIQKNPVISWTGINAVGNTKGLMIVASLDVAPLGFVMFFNNTKEMPKELADITELGYKYQYDDVISCDFVFSLLERNIHYPLDFRTKEEILEAYAQNHNSLKK